MARAILESKEQSTEAILIFFHLYLLSSCTFYSRTKAWWSCKPKPSTLLTLIFAG